MADRSSSPSATEEHLGAGGSLRFPALAAAARPAEPVTLALPLPAGTLPDPAGFRLLDEGGAPLPVQARATSRWPDGSVRWLFARRSTSPAGRPRTWPGP